MEPNPEYIAQRDLLIPLAVKFANEKVGKKPKRKEGQTPTAHYREVNKWGDRWNFHFHGRMNELWRTN
jgi:hypothetical protein